MHAPMQRTGNGGISMPSSNNEDAKELLEKLYLEALSMYPFDSESEVDERYCFAMGVIAGVASEALRAVEEGRAIRLTKTGFAEFVLRHEQALRRDEGENYEKS
jgi:hypothetical protein